MEYPKTIQTVVLDGCSLTLEAFVAVARYGARVELSDKARAALSRFFSRKAPAARPDRP